MPHSKRLFRALALSCALLTAGAVASTAAEAATPSLQGEVLIAGPDAGAPDPSLFEVTLRCGGTAPSWWTYSSSGTATGPYPGTFTETGTVYVDADGTGATAPVLTLHSDFAIASGTTIITGTKDLKMVATNQGSCDSRNDSYDAKFVATTNYTASIDTGAGVFTDSGTSTLDTRRQERFDLSNGSSLGGVSRYRSDFTSTGGATDPTTPIGSTAAGVGLIGSLRGPVIFGFYGKQTTMGLKGLCGVFDPTRKMLVACINVETYVRVDGTVVMTGDAYVNRVKTKYRIEAKDGGSSWTGDSFKITTDSGYTSVQSASFFLGVIRIK